MLFASTLTVALLGAAATMVCMLTLGCCPAALVANAGPASFPLSARIFGTIRGITGKLGFTNPLTGQPEVGGGCAPLWSHVLFAHGAALLGTVIILATVCSVLQGTAQHPSVGLLKKLSWILPTSAAVQHGP